jgi:chaperonin GroES
MRDNIIQEEFMTIKPMGDRVLVKMEEVQEKTAGGIFIPQTAQEKTQIADVVAVGDDESITVKKGDKVMYDKYAGTSVKADGQEYLILHMSDVLAVISYIPRTPTWD